jgi:uncharacterized protein (DUF2147 family)
MNIHQTRTSLATTIFNTLLLTSLLAQADPGPTGRWKVFDEDTGEAKAIIKIQQQQGVLYGWVDEILNAHKNTKLPRCTECQGKLKNAPVLGLKIIQDMRREGDTWNDRIMDPKTGEVYQATMSLNEEGHKLEVRGYIGIPLLSRTQVWQRLE